MPSMKKINMNFTYYLCLLWCYSLALSLATDTRDVTVANECSSVIIAKNKTKSKLKIEVQALGSKVQAKETTGQMLVLPIYPPTTV